MAKKVIYNNRIARARELFRQGNYSAEHLADMLLCDPNDIVRKDVDFDYVENDPNSVLYKGYGKLFEEE